MKKLLLLLSAALTALAVSACGASAPASQHSLHRKTLPQQMATKPCLLLTAAACPLRCAMNRAPTIYTAVCR